MDAWVIWMKDVEELMNQLSNVRPKVHIDNYLFIAMVLNNLRLIVKVG